ncbi:MAG TPA: FMN-binding protein [Gemmatimonadaceae bacterium]|nr:FMN-binding protein [Gemmatimonadaceae bacterium]
MTNPGVVLPKTEVPSWKLLLTLGGAGAIVGLCIVLIYRWTLPTIEAYKAGELRTAIAEVLHSPERCDTLWLVNGALTAARPPGEGTMRPPRVFLGYDRAGRPLGFAITASQTGFAEPIELIFGYDAASHRLLGMKILVSKETPGIADKIEKPVFTAQFEKAEAPLQGVKGGGERGTDLHNIAMITGATVSSRAVIKGINGAIARWQPLLDTYMASAGGTR